VRPTNEQFRKAVLAAKRKVGFTCTGIYWGNGAPEVGDVYDNLHSFPMRIKIVRRITAKLRKQWFKALTDCLPKECATQEAEGKCRYYEVKLLRPKRVRAALEKVR